MNDEEIEAQRLRCWNQFLGAVNAYLQMNDRQPGLDLIAEIRHKYGDEVAEQSKREMNNWILKRKK